MSTLGTSKQVHGKCLVVLTLLLDPIVMKPTLFPSSKHVVSSKISPKRCNPLSVLRDAAKGESNLMLPILTAVKEYATLGEICGVLRDVFGEYRYRG